jgi:hypothetical protein
MQLCGFVARETMMRRSAVLVLLAAVFAVSVLLTAVEGLRTIGADDMLLFERLGVLQGHLAPLFASSFVWSRYPAAPTHLSALIDEKAFLATIPLLLAALYFVHIRGRRPFPLQIVVCLAVALVPYAVGAIALHNRPVDDPRLVGSWLVIMILGPMYALIICAIVCIVELLRPRARSRSIDDLLPIECSPVTTAAPRQ